MLLRSLRQVAVAKSLRDGKAKLDIESITLHRSRVDKNLPNTPNDQNISKYIKIDQKSPNKATSGIPGTLWK
jgi:hypothetical protein